MKTQKKYGQYMCEYIYIYIYIYVYISVYIYIYICQIIHIYVCICIYEICIDKYMCIHQEIPKDG